MFLQRKKRASRRRYKLKKNNSSGLLRLTVFRSINNIYAQLIDDTEGITLLSSSSLDKSLQDLIKDTNKVSAAFQVGKMIGNSALKQGIKKVMFDCGGYKYHGRVSAVAKGACEVGLII